MLKFIVSYADYNEGKIVTEQITAPSWHDALLAHSSCPFDIPIWTSARHPDHPVDFYAATPAQVSDFLASNAFGTMTIAEIDALGNVTIHGSDA